MNNKEFISELATRAGYDQKSTQKLVNNIITAMSDAFVADNSVIVPNFGVFETKWPERSTCMAIPMWRPCVRRHA